jgi:hypothetical protein
MYASYPLLLEEACEVEEEDHCTNQSRKLFLAVPKNNNVFSMQTFAGAYVTGPGPLAGELDDTPTEAEAIL